MDSLSKIIDDMSCYDLEMGAPIDKVNEWYSRLRYLNNSQDLCRMAADRVKVEVFRGGGKADVTRKAVGWVTENNLLTEEQRKEFLNKIYPK